VTEDALITHTDFVFLPITSFERAEAFYTGVLGLPLSKRYRNGIGGELETGEPDDPAPRHGQDRTRVRTEQGRHRPARR
jgi:catechol 2,3-dioxygenase-like lactoylglutathione lyase family enzyme